MICALIISVHIIEELIMSHLNIWNIEHSIETTASPDAVWRLFSDVPGWARWNAGIAHIAIDGPFAAGTWFTMTPPGEAPLRCRLIEVREAESFVDETRVGDLVVTVAHRIAPHGAGARITYALEARGPEAAAIGAFVASDFPDVLASLARLAEEGAA